MNKKRLIILIIILVLVILLFRYVLYYSHHANAHLLPCLDDYAVCGTNSILGRLSCRLICCSRKYSHGAVGCFADPTTGKTGCFGANRLVCGQ